MTVADLYMSVAQLGFETALEYENGFVFAANRAILEVNALRPAASSFHIYHRPLKNVLASSFEPTLKEDELIFECTDVKAYYFECDGNGAMYIEHYNETARTWQTIEWKSLSSSGAFKPYRGFIKRDGAFITGRVRLRFTGDYIYSVKSVAAYSQLLGKDESLIPAYEPYTRYDASEMVSDFLSLRNPPIEEHCGYRHLNQEYSVEDGRIILLPREAEGYYKVIYNRRPRPIEHLENLSDDLTVIDLDEELCALLPILIASYIWMDDEPEKAQYYLSIYQQRAAYIEHRSVNSSPVIMRSADGW